MEKEIAILCREIAEALIAKYDSEIPNDPI
ncbi:hypothetical protein SAMN04487777_103909 [Priestia aryabhattai B8W22]|nr:hypothetical protein SAMN04487777_103909 [Priestia aryabhattai B8W22]